ncbi:hypothetical protein [Acidianus ambivalens]|uniref:Uncharacterized protein n=1 Tax=Acidianus ambivalens TaxID=2283 RepID=A0A650CW89_ACIAM|nr:hypothetical protein [Acidianus ambivalens]MQL56520.1 hypothetical protein [Acidianus ambivalens]QGR21955.1 hypothetical protein D1866_08005 [Acidianus ambivalens]
MNYKYLFRAFNGAIGLITIYSFVHTFLVPFPAPLFVRIAGPGGLFLGGTIALTSAIAPDKLYALFTKEKYGKIIRGTIILFVIYMIGTVEIFFAPKNYVGELSGVVSSVSFTILLPLIVFYYNKINKNIVYIMIFLLILMLAFSLPKLNSLAQLLGPAGPPGLYFTGALLFHIYFEHTYTLVFANVIALKPKVLQSLSRLKERLLK